MLHMVVTKVQIEMELFPLIPDMATRQRVTT